MSFGRYLIQERELRGISRKEIAELTKIAPTVIQALEEDQVDRLPDRVYLVGYLRAYAEAVGLDGDEVVLRWEESARPDLDEATAAEDPTPAERRSMHLTAVALTAILLAVVAAVALLIR